MDDSSKSITKEKRHRSSSSLSEEKRSVTLNNQMPLKKKDSVSQIGHQFLVSEARCDELQAKLELVRNLKKRNKRSMTKITASSIAEEGGVPLMTIRTQPKKKVTPKGQPIQIQMLSPSANCKKSYLDPAMLEQHRMICAYNQYRDKYIQGDEQSKPTDMYVQKTKTLRRRYRTLGAGEEPQMTGKPVRGRGGESFLVDKHEKVQDVDNNFVNNKLGQKASKRGGNARKTRKKCNSAVGETFRVGLKGEHRVQSHIGGFTTDHPEGGQVVELFTKNNDEGMMNQMRRTSWHAVNVDNEGNIIRQVENDVFEPLETRPPTAKKELRSPCRKKSKNRRYEHPTVASQLKHANNLCYYGNSIRYANIPFVVSKSTSPSHNLGVNIQQVLSGIKMQQPVSRVPFTIAHQMGLRHVPLSRSTKASVYKQVCFDEKNLNVLNFGDKQLLLPMKCMSFNRLLKLYRENDGIVSRFLRSIGQPNYFYTSVYNISSEEDLDGATSKGQSRTRETKKSLAEYANLYREYENVERCIRERGSDKELEKRKEDLIKELAVRESHIRKVVHDCRLTDNQDSAATGDELR